jgi:RNA polymerase sigma-54 factor
MTMGMLPQQQMKVSPSLITLNTMLTLSTAELQQLVQQELSENPALEQVEMDEAPCPVCGRPQLHGICPFCAQEQAAYVTAERQDLAAGEREDVDPLLLVAAPISLEDVLSQDLHVSLPGQDHFIVDFLLGSLNSQGFLDGELEDFATALSISPERVEQVLRKLQELAPPGVGARNVQECLLIQVERLERAGIANSIVGSIVRDHWVDLGSHRYSDIARALGVSYEDVVAARDFIREYLRPFPLMSDEREGGAPALVPDVVIFEDGKRLVVEVVESRQFSLRISAAYHGLVEAVARGQQSLSEDDRTHVTTYVSRARTFLTHLKQRRETIRRITEYLVERQEQFLRHGIRHLEPLTRGEVAAVLGVHESTVSRATANKYVQLPNRSIVPYSIFFRASLPVKDVIKELIDGEAKPLTDDQIVEILRERGVEIARRTVAKYRAQLGILPSHLR